MQDENQQLESNQQQTQTATSGEPSVKPGAKYTDEDVNGIVARVKREEREKAAKLQQAQPVGQHSADDINKLVDEKLNARIEHERMVSFERNVSAKLLAKFPEGQKKHGDFNETVDSFNFKDDLPLLHEIAGLENSVDLLYALGKSPTRADSFNRGLASSNPAKRAQTARELKEYAQKIAGKQTKAPNEPPPPVSRMKNSANVYQDNGGDDVLEAAKRRARSKY